MTVSRVAYFTICNHCHQHACIVLPNGKHSNEFVTKKEGSQEVERLFAHRDIALDEAAFLKDQIWDSALPVQLAHRPRFLDALLVIHEGVEPYPFGLTSAEEDEDPPTLH